MSDVEYAQDLVDYLRMLNAYEADELTGLADFARELGVDLDDDDV